MRGSQVLDEERPLEFYGAAQRVIAEELPFLYMVNPLAFDAIRDRVKGIEYSELGDGFWNLYELRVEFFFGGGDRTKITTPRR